jgi:hypothetical protein
MVQKKNTSGLEAGGHSNQPEFQSQLRALAKKQARVDTGVPVAKIGRGKHPVAGVNHKKSRSK